jgi:hypothetical protein
MKLVLSHVQRLNLIALLGAQRVDVAGIRTIWKLQDMLALDDNESHAIDLRIKMVEGQEVQMWSTTAELPAKEYEFNEVEFTRIRDIVQNWPHHQAGGARQWLEPLLEQLPPDEPYVPGLRGVR